MAETYVALLRGVNVGGNNKLPMKALAELFAKVGCSDVRTFIQSGNVIFRAPKSVASRVGKTLPVLIEEQFAFSPPVVLRTAQEMANVFNSNPFLAAGEAEDTLHVLFLADLPSAAAVEKLDPNRSPPGRFIVCGADVYLYLPKGVGDTKLTNAYFDSKLSTVSTGRNWRTVGKLVELSRG